MSTIKVTTEDLETKETQSVYVDEGSYVLVTNPPCELTSTGVYINGTHQLTITGFQRRYRPAGGGEEAPSRRV